MAGRRHKWNGPRAFSLPGLALIFVIVFVAVFAFATSISISTPPRLGAPTDTITGWLLEPQACRDAGIDPGNRILTGSAPAGDTQSQLILGAANKQNQLRGRGGDDCIIGGGGGDRLIGDAGTDVCIGGSGNDRFDVSCEIQIQ